MSFKKGYKPSKESRKKLSISLKRYYQKHRHHNWKGGKHINCGYVRVWCPDHPSASKGYVKEHRLVMEKHLGRYLIPPEEIHHINGIKTDNRIENLELISNHSTHIVKERKERFWSTRKKPMLQKPCSICGV